MINNHQKKSFSFFFSCQNSPRPPHISPLLPKYPQIQIFPPKNFAQNSTRRDPRHHLPLPAEQIHHQKVQIPAGALQKGVHQAQNEAKKAKKKRKELLQANNLYSIQEDGTTAFSDNVSSQINTTKALTNISVTEEEESFVSQNMSVSMPKKEYKFNPDELDELVYKRKAYESFQEALNFMKVSEAILKRKVTENTPQDTQNSTNSLLKKGKRTSVNRSPRKKKKDGRRRKMSRYPGGRKMRKKKKEEDILQALAVQEEVKTRKIEEVFKILFVSNEEFRISLDSFRLRTFILSYALFKVQASRVQQFSLQVPKS